MGLAMISDLTGLDRGVRRLSELNLILAVLLMGFELFAGPTGFLLKALVQNFGLYLDHFFIRTFNLYAYEPRDWMAHWTLFYWAWWIAWSPFVGMFIARISRGRTVREFVIGVLLVPSAFTFLWMTVFGNTAMYLDMGVAGGAISQAVQADLSTALFKFFEYLPGTTITSTLAVALIVVFFVTSADSGSMVIDTIAAGGAEETPTWQRVYWCVLQGVAAALLMLAGGLSALQAATLVAALPFAIIMILLAWGLYRGMRADLLGVAPVPDAPLRVRLKRIVAPSRRRDIEAQIERIGSPALEAVREALAQEGVAASIEREADGVALRAKGAGADFVYRLQAASRALPAFSLLEAPEGRRAFEWRLRASTDDVGPKGSYDVSDYSQARLISDVLEKLALWRTRHAFAAQQA
jgi:choline/glycine/proline betaine transport protein